MPFFSHLVFIPLGLAICCVSVPFPQLQQCWRLVTSYSSLSSVFTGDLEVPRRSVLHLQACNYYLSIVTCSPLLCSLLRQIKVGGGGVILSPSLFLFIQWWWVTFQATEILPSFLGGNHSPLFCLLSWAVFFLLTVCAEPFGSHTPDAAMARCDWGLGRLECDSCVCQSCLNAQVPCGGKFMDPFVTAAAAILSSGRKITDVTCWIACVIFMSGLILHRKLWNRFWFWNM